MDVYQQNKLNRAQIVFEEAAKAVYREYEATSHGTKTLRKARDNMQETVKILFKGLASMDGGF